MAANPSLYMQIAKAGYDTSSAIGNTLGQYSANRKMSRMNAASYRAQIVLNNQTLQRELGYLNESVAQQNWNIGDVASMLQGSQRASMAASGFATSTGDQRLLSDTERRANEQVAGNNRSAYLQSFESIMQANLENLRLEYAAKAQEAIAKQNSPLRALTASMFAGLGAFASNIGNLGDAGAFGTPAKGKNQSPVMGGNE